MVGFDARLELPRHPEGRAAVRQLGAGRDPVRHMAPAASSVLDTALVKEPAPRSVHSF